MTAGVMGVSSVNAMHAIPERGYARLMNAWSRRGHLVLDLAICAALLAFGVSITTQPDAPTGAGAGTDLDTVLLPAVVLPVLLRRRAPFAAAAALAAGCVVSGIPTFDQFRLGLAIPAALLILFSLARHAERPRALGGLALVLAGMVFIGFTDVVLQGRVAYWGWCSSPSRCASGSGPEGGS
jgi:hypothetical protein